jgi:Hsp20/alpha crystallin family protein
MAKKQELQVQQKRQVQQKQESTIPSRQFMPVTDIVETDQAPTLIVEMPGVKKENVDVQVENDVLMIQGRIDFSNYEWLQPGVKNQGATERWHYDACGAEAGKGEAAKNRRKLTVRIIWPAAYFSALPHALGCLRTRSGTGHSRRLARTGPRPPHDSTMMR